MTDLSEKHNEEKMPVTEEITDKDKSDEAAVNGESAKLPAVEGAASESGAVVKAEPSDNKKSKKEKKKKFGRKKGKKTVKRVIIVLLLIFLVVAVIFRLGERNVAWAKKVSDTVHLDKLPGVSKIADILPVDEICGVLNIGEAVQTGTSETIQVYTAERRTIRKLLTGTGTLQPLDEYTVTALSSGEVVEDYFEEGDFVEEDQLLMKIDSSNLDTSLERAQNNYDDSVEALEDLRESKDDLKVTSDYSGVIQVMNFEAGDDIRAGEVVASIVDRDTMLIDIPFMQADTINIKRGDRAVLTVSGTFEEIGGTVDEISPSYQINSNGVKTVYVTIAVQNPGVITENVSATATIGEYTCTEAAYFYYNVNKSVVSEVSGEVLSVYKDEGDYISKGEVILVLDSADIDKSIEKAERNVKDAENALEDAREAYDNYDITAPIAGTVVEKNYKRGEKIGSAGGGSTIAVIYDLSALVFEMNIDELDIDSISLGQGVTVTSDAKDGMSYTGEVTKISIQGVTSNGTTYYPITVTVNDYGQNVGNALRPGMNIDAEIIIEEAVDAVAVPVDAVGRGNRVTVVRNYDSTVNADGSDKENKMPVFDEKNDGMQRPEGTENESPEGMPKQDAAEGEIPVGVQRPDDMQRPEGVQTYNGGNGVNGGYTTVPSTVETEEIVVVTGISDESYIEIISGIEEGDMVVVQTASAPQSQNPFGMMGMGGMNMGGGMPGGMGGGMPSGNRGGNMDGRPGM